jgi:hypothetical protein
LHLQMQSKYRQSHFKRAARGVAGDEADPLVVALEARPVRARIRRWRRSARDAARSTQLAISGMLSDVITGQDWTFEVHITDTDPLNSSNTITASYQLSISAPQLKGICLHPGRGHQRATVSCHSCQDAVHEANVTPVR